MRVKIRRAELEGSIILLDVEDHREAAEFIRKFKPGNYELRRVGNKRSLDANAYAWVLINALASELNVPPVEVYRDAIRSIGGVSVVGSFRIRDASEICRKWESNGLGWQTDITDSCVEDCVNIILYYGSSVYDTKQMSRLIDSLVQDCEAVGIETKDPNDIRSLLEEWDG